MKITAVFFSLLILSILSSPAGASDGPLRVRNQFPLFLHANVPFLEKAAIEDSLTASFSYSSAYLVSDSSMWSAHLDMEVAELAFMIRKTFHGFAELGVEIPIICFSSGFMDEFLDTYHSTFGFSDYGRRNRPENKFLYEVRRNGALIISGENGQIGIGDVKLTLKKPVLTGDTNVSLKGNLELPTGDPKSGFGNGSVDTGIGVALDQKISETFMGYLNFGAVFPGDLKGYERIELRSFAYGGAALEAFLSKKLSLSGQILFHGSPFPETDIGPVDRTAAILSLGGRYSSGKSGFEISLTEDPNTAGAPDFTLNFSYKRKF